MQADREGRAQELADYYRSSQLKVVNDQLADKAGSGTLTPEMKKELATRSATTTNAVFGWKTILKVQAVMKQDQSMLAGMRQLGCQPGAWCAGM